MSKLQFFVENFDESEKPEGRFTRDWKAEEGLDPILASKERGQITTEQALDAARDLPFCLDNLELTNFIAGCYWEIEEREEAGEMWERALNHALQLIPSDFKGQIIWGSTDNRPFLRVAYGALLSRMEAEDAKGARALSRQILRWCPSDNLGVRYLQPDIDFMSESYEQAFKKYAKNGKEDPSAWYQAGRIMFRKSDYVRACTLIRLGIAANPYIAEGITGRTTIDDHLYWHGSNVHEAEWAVAYLNGAMGRWDADERDFVDWVFNNPSVLRERAELMSIHEALTYTDVGPERSAWVSKKFEFPNRIDDEVSRSMVKKVRIPGGDEHWPWDRDGVMRRRARG